MRTACGRSVIVHPMCADLWVAVDICCASDFDFASQRGARPTSRKKTPKAPQALKADVDPLKR